MKVLESLSIPGAHLVEGTSHPDERGSFGRIFECGFLAELGCSEPLRQVNISRTAHRGCVRGLHMQRPPRSGFKLVACLRGRIWDVCLDARQDSAAKGRWEGRELDGTRPIFMLVPPGCAHGFQTLTDDVEMIYMMTEDHDPSAETRIDLRDPDLDISWPLPITRISPADAGAPGFESLFGRNAP